MVLPFAAGLLLPSTAGAAAIIDFAAAGCTGGLCGPIAAGESTLTLTATGGTFQYKTLNGATGLGISGLTGGEIDVNESVNGAFSSAVQLDSFQILFIYNGPEFGDPEEVASVSINGGAVAGRLVVDGENTASWSLGGLVTNCGDTSALGTGCFTVFNPFGSSAVSSFSFTATSAGVNLPNDSDYSLGSLQVSTVPEPASVLLLGSGLAALLARRRTSGPKR